MSIANNTEETRVTRR